MMDNSTDRKVEMQWETNATAPLADTDGPYDAQQAQNPAAGAITAQQIAEIVAQALSSLRIYVVEADITNAQNSVKAVVEQSTF